MKFGNCINNLKFTIFWSKLLTFSEEFEFEYPIFLALSSWQSQNPDDIVQPDVKPKKRKIEKSFQFVFTSFFALRNELACVLLNTRLHCISTGLLFLFDVSSIHECDNGLINQQHLIS